MTCPLKDRVAFAYDNFAGASYLLLKMNAAEKIQNYQVEMIGANKIDGILSFTVRQMDDIFCLYYNITSKLALSHYLKRRRIGRNEFIGILTGISRLLLECRKYFLSDMCFLLDCDYVYINPSTLEVSLVYIPVQQDINAGIQFKNFVMDFVINRADVEDSGIDNFMVKILRYLKADYFNIPEFERLLRELTDSGSGTETAGGRSSLEADSVEEQGEEHLPEVSGKQEQVKYNRLSGRAPLLIGLASQLLIVLIVFFSSGFLSSLSTDTAVTYAAVILVIAALDILLFKKLFGKNALTIKKLDGEPRENIWSPGPKEVIRPDESANALATESNDGVLQENCYETVLLDCRKEGYPVLRSGKDSTAEEIAISKPDFVIGRLGGQVDHILLSNAVGKVHAQILSADGAYFIKDLNSRNGTYVNDLRIESNKEYEIRNNDKIALANMEYIFVTPF